MIIEFDHTVTETEVRFRFLNLKDDSGTLHGRDFPPHLTKLVIIDGEGRATRAQKHGNTQIWGTLYQWFRVDGIQPGAIVHVKHDQEERRDGFPVVYLTRTEAKAAPSQSAPTEEESAPEIPLGSERHIEDFLAENLSLIEPGLRLFKDEDGHTGRQYPTDVGTIDLLCVRETGDFLIIELKRAKGSDATVGQISRYIGWVSEYLAGGRQTCGLILAHDRDDRLEYAVKANSRLALRYYRLRLELLP